MSNILVIAAHPDDEVLGVGGTMAVLSRRHAVSVLIVTEGCSSQYEGEDVPEIIRIKKECARKANRLLGVERVLFGDLPDMKLDSVPHVQINRVIEQAVEEVQPDIVFTHHFGDVNMDHKRVFESTMVAARPTAGSRIKKVYTYETLSSTEWQSADPRQIFVPQAYVDIQDTLEKKAAALELYNQEVREFPHPRSAQAVRNLAAMRGQSVGLYAAEAFGVIRERITGEI